MPSLGLMMVIGDCRVRLIKFGRQMNYTRIAVLTAIVMLTACNRDETVQSSEFDKFTGRWTLSVVEVQPDSNAVWEPRQDHYKNRQGFILYDGRGGMGVHHVTEDYEKYEFEGTGGLDSLTRKDLRHLADNFVYFGKYRVDDSLDIIEHHIESANFQRLWGATAKRKYLFVGDTLILNPITNRYPNTRLKWIRLNDMD